MLSSNQWQADSCDTFTPTTPDASFSSIGRRDTGADTKCVPTNTGRCGSYPVDEDRAPSVHATSNDPRLEHARNREATAP
jgi:hypothetical protein